jgi:hypothetical protein
MKKLTFIVSAAALGFAAGLASAQPTGDSGAAGGGGRAMIRQACAADFQRYCPHARPGLGGGMRQCVMSHRADFSDGCKSAIAQMRARMQARQGQPGAAACAALNGCRPSDGR